MDSCIFRSASPESQGIPSGAILDFLDEVEREHIEIKGLLVMRHGYLVAEGYWKPFAQGLPHRMFSAGKALVSTAILFAIGEGLLHLDDRVVDIFAPPDVEALGGRWQRMTLYHLLTMTTGHTTDFFGSAREHGGDRSRLFFAQPLAYEPGTHFLYNNTVPDMLAIALYRVTGQRVFAYLEPRLFRPLGMDGLAVAANGHLDELPTMCCSTRALAKLAILYANEGSWNGTQLLDRKLAKMAGSYLVPSLQLPPPPLVAEDTKYGYGFQIWRNSVGGFRIDGGRGQFGIVSPEMDMVIAVNANEDDQGIIPQLLFRHITSRLYARPLSEDMEGQAALKARLAGLTWALKGEGVPEAQAFCWGEWQLQTPLLGISGFTLARQGRDILLQTAGGEALRVVPGSGQWQPVAADVGDFPETHTGNTAANFAASMNLITGMDPAEVVASARFDGPQALEVAFRSTGWMGAHVLRLDFGAEAAEYWPGNSYNLFRRSKGLVPATLEIHCEKTTMLKQ